MDMHGSRHLLAAVLLCGLAACHPTLSVKAPVTYTGALPQPSAMTPLRLTDGGDYIHPPTGLVFPDHLGDLQRDAILVATENADDVGANYKIPGRQDFVGTGMAFPIWNVIDRQLSISDVPDACEEGYIDARETARQRLTNARIVKEEAIATPQFKDAIFTRVVVFEADGGTNLADFPIRSELYWQCGIYEVFVVLHRISYVPGLVDAAGLTSAVVAGAPKRR
jgi:hypothetical protein